MVAPTLEFDVGFPTIEFESAIPSLESFPINLEQMVAKHIIKQTSHLNFEPLAQRERPISRWKIFLGGLRSSQDISRRLHPSPSSCARFHGVDLSFAKPESRFARCPSRNRRRTLSLAVRLCTCRLILIQRFTLSSSIHVAWMLLFSLDALTSMHKWCKRWNFGRSRNWNFFCSTAVAASEV